MKYSTELVMAKRHKNANKNGLVPRLPSCKKSAKEKENWLVSTQADSKVRKLNYAVTPPSFPRLTAHWLRRNQKLSTLHWTGQTFAAERFRITLEGNKSEALIYTKSRQAKAPSQSAMQQNEGQGDDLRNAAQIRTYARGVWGCASG